MQDEASTLSFDYLQLRLVFESRGLLKLPDLPGSMIRGAFGVSLKRLFCRTPGNCGSFCKMGNVCTYGRLFETPLDGSHEVLGDVSFAPHPFALHVRTNGQTLLEPGQMFHVDWTVWGDALQETHYSILAWRQAGDMGFGVGRVPALLKEVKRCDTDEVVYSEGRPAFGNLRPATFHLTPSESTANVSVTTLSPLRIKSGRALFGLQGNGEMALPADVLFSALTRRLKTCVGFVTPDNSEELPRTKSSRFLWKESTRYSTRQRTTMQMGGLMGDVKLSGVTGMQYSMLKAGEILQVGKNTSMGLGKYKIEEEV